MSNMLTLSDGSVVTFRPHYTHRADREYNAIIMDGVTFTTEMVKDKDGNPVIDEETGQPVEKTVPHGMKAENANKANEALIKALIQSVERDKKTVFHDAEWLDNLPEEDFKALQKFAEGMKQAVDDKKKEEAKKS